MMPYKNLEDRRESDKKYNYSKKGRITRKRARHKYSKTEKGKANVRRYQQSHKDEITEQRRKYRNTKRGRAMLKIHKKNRKYLKLVRGIAIGKGITTEQWEARIREHNYRCAYCGRKCALTTDHVIPLSKGGEHSIRNIVPACAECNDRKGVKFWKPKVFKKMG